MRSIARGPCPEALDGADSVGGRERAAATLFFANSRNPEDTYSSFGAYKNDGVRAALTEMFGTKCCYCESQIAHVMPGDIEHFRPKGGFTSSTSILIKPGYYWLAADWNNLLLACIDCNRYRGHLDDDGNLMGSGKANHFPLHDESRRASRPGDEAHEQPLLLDPCSDPVEEYFEYAVGGVIRPAFRAGLKHDRAVATISILGLDRPKLSKRRGEKMLRVDAAIRKYHKAVQVLIDHPDHPASEIYVAGEIDELKRLWGEDDEYSVMVRARIEGACPEASGSV